jgi:hypothetical protein
MKASGARAHDQPPWRGVAAPLFDLPDAHLGVSPVPFDRRASRRTLAIPVAGGETSEKCGESIWMN